MAVARAEVDARARELEERSRTLKRAKEAIDKMTSDAEDLLRQRKESLEKIAGLTRQEARGELMKEFDKELIEEKSKKIREMKEEVQKNVEEDAKKLLVETMRFGSTDYVVEYTTSKVALPDEEIKGRIIGKEGRNIKKLEELSGVEFDLDSSQGEILLSCFDPIRREVARLSLERLIKDGRIQPARIEDIYKQTSEEIDHIIFKAGDDLCHRVGAYNIPRDLVYMLGKFKYRFSYGQNMIEHTLEETKMGVALAYELKANVDTVRLGCLFHDIGKIVTEDEGTHIQLGVDLLNKHKIAEEVVNCIAEHHEDKPFSSIESAIVNLVDHVSGARPGARGEDYESYIKRMRALEDAAKQFDGIDKVYAISAGREVRVFVEPTKVDDDSTAFLAREIAKKIELEQTYPGVVKVTVIRETRVTETAK
ncbi:ribonuclease Y [candidate division WWE3 bacterium RBG_19FT_COMBO_34_6]|uniref:Ribonuclease Y n=1 Tax=candidate division WWE3 bacterium RBG_19FT_COMBO_34_6 TaxID=1802612 RepID=A0A1F4UL44_UNCKA|nr:MAG: ribonuclease Y [candidate division WWE3 bacterium RBG_19FT_COMBO_34_6]